MIICPKSDFIANYSNDDPSADTIIGASVTGNDDVIVQGDLGLCNLYDALRKNRGVAQIIPDVFEGDPGLIDRGRQQHDAAFPPRGEQVIAKRLVACDDRGQCGFASLAACYQGCLALLRFRVALLPGGLLVNSKFHFAER